MLQYTTQQYTTQQFYTTQQYTTQQYTTQQFHISPTPLDQQNQHNNTSYMGSYYL